MNKKFITIAVILLGFNICCYSQSNKNFVPDSCTAIGIAISKWLPIWGNDLYKESPFHAVLEDDSIWFVTGSLELPSPKIINGDTIFHAIFGGAVFIKIRKNDGSIIEIGHGK